MERSQLEQLYQRICWQDPYPGETCLTEERFTDFILGGLSSAENDRVEDHLQECSGCQALEGQLRQDLSWFNRHQSDILAGLLDKARQQRTGPWEQCVPIGLLEQYEQELLPQTAPGRTCRQGIADHLAACVHCRRRLEHLKRLRPDRLIITLPQRMQRSLSDAKETLTEMLQAMRELASVVGTGWGIQAMPGFRSQASGTLTALILDEQGSALLDSEGRAQTMVFDLIRAEVAADGVLLIELSADWTRSAAVTDTRIGLTMALDLEDRRLLLPQKQIPADGQVVIIRDVVSGVPIPLLPKSALRATVSLL